ncbi:MAG: RNA methyltransferase [Acidobacteriota bacterium]|nr:RNA methyltransferase [Acidobacteriota bacterium]
MTTISSRRHPLVTAFRAAAARHDSAGPLLLDGEHLIAEAAAAGLTIRTLAVTPARLDALGDLARRVEAAGAAVVTVAGPVLAAMSPVRTPSGIVALADRPHGGLDAALSGRMPLVAVAVDVQDPGNVGALVRTAEAAGATGFLTCGGSADPFGWKALRGAMGSAFRLPIAAAVAATDLFAALERRGIRPVAMMPAGGVGLYDAPLDGPLAVLLGGEGGGLGPALAARAALQVTIPMQAPVESLNVAVAGALLLFEVARRRAGRTA